MDAEIKQLKERRQQIQQELSKAEEGDRAALEQQLSRLDAELKTKDNDSYRKQHAVVTYG